MNYKKNQNLGICIELYGNLWKWLTELKKRCIGKQNVNIVNTVNYVAYICNNFFLNLVYAPYQEFSLFLMTKDIGLQEQLHPKKINYVYKLCFNIYIMYSMQSQKNADP